MKDFRFTSGGFVDYPSPATVNTDMGWLGARPAMPPWSGMGDYMLPGLAKGGVIKKKKSAVVGEGKAPELVTNGQRAAVVDEPTVVTPTTDVTVKPLSGDFNADAYEQRQTPETFRTAGLVNNVAKPLPPVVAPPVMQSTPESVMAGRSPDYDLKPGLPEAPPVDTEFEGNVTGLAGKTAELRKAVNTPAEKQSPWKQGVWWALQGIRETLKPGSGNLQYLGEAKREHNIDEINQDIARLQAERQLRANNTITDQTIEKGSLVNKGIGIENRLNEYKLPAARISAAMAGRPDLNMIFGSGQVTPEAAAQFNALTGSNVQPVDVRPRNIMEVGGQYYGATPQGDMARIPGAPIKLSNTFGQVNTPHGIAYTTSEQIAQANMQGINDLNKINAQGRNQIRNAQAREGFNREKYNLEIENKNTANTAKYAQEEAVYNTKNAEYDAEIDRVQTEINVLKADTNPLKKKENAAAIKAKETELRSLRDKKRSLKQPIRVPELRKMSTQKNASGNEVPAMDFEGYKAMMLEGGKSYSMQELRKAFEAAKKAGKLIDTGYTNAGTILSPKRKRKVKSLRKR